MKYRIGLNIGVSYIGWGVIECTDMGEPFRIERTGVRVFDAAEVPKTGESLAATRRAARTLRRRMRRMKHRRERVKLLLEKKGIVEVESFMEGYHKEKRIGVHQLRYEALERPLTNEEIAQIMIYFVKHRGFKSSRKLEYTQKDTGKVLDATRNNKLRMQENNYRSAGDMVYKDPLFHVDTPSGKTLLIVRNKDGDYKRSILRELLEEEIKTIFRVQRELGNPITTEELEEEYLGIFLSQRAFDQGPGNQADGTPSPYAGDLIQKMIGRCALEPDQRRASIATFSAEYFYLLQKVNKLKIVDEAGNSRKLKAAQRKIIIELAFIQREVKYSTIRKRLQLSNKERFKRVQFTRISEEQALSSESKTVFVSLEWFHEYKKIFPEMELFHQELNPKMIEILDQIGSILSLYKGDDKRIEELSKLDLYDEQIQQLIVLNPSKYHFLSIKALKKLIPYAEKGLHYNEVCSKAGYQLKRAASHKKKVLIEKEVRELLMSQITSPVVRRSISQMFKLVNAIIREYGSPIGIQVTCSSMLTKSFQDRVKLEKSRAARQKENEKMKKFLMERGILKPSGQDIVKYRLWQQQKGMCMYSGEKIEFNEIFNKERVDIDHIIPFSVCLDDSYKNKVLVRAEENRSKGDQIPYYYFGHDSKKWKAFEDRVEYVIDDQMKKQFLLTKNLDSEEKEEIAVKNLIDTRTVCRLLEKTLSGNLFFAPLESEPVKEKLLFKKGKEQVLLLNESIVSYLCNRWSISNIDQESDKRYALKAIVAGCCTEYMLYRILLNVHGNEIAYGEDFILIDKIKNRVLRRIDYTQGQWLVRFPQKLLAPWRYFLEEVGLHMAENPKLYLKSCEKVKNLEKHSIKPIFVSYKVDHKVTGPGHADTIRSPRHFQEESIVISRTELKNLKLNGEGEIEGYYNPASDRLLYEALKARLRQYGGRAEKAFQEPFYKPKSDGTRGPIVKKVKVFKRVTVGVMLNHNRGVAENTNGSMVRIDIFMENGRYFFVPIYTSDFKKKTLPNKAATADKLYQAWRTVKEEDFLFSLYPKDVIKFKNKRGVRIRNSKGELVRLTECIGYFITADISSGSIRGRTHDNSFEFRGVGIQTLKYLKKYQVDLLGNLSEVRKEKRIETRIYK